MGRPVAGTNVLSTLRVASNGFDLPLLSRLRRLWLNLIVFNVCPGCGEYSSDKQVEPDDNSPTMAYAVCRACGHRHPFLRLPLFVLTGASASGKTTVALRLVRDQPRVIVLDSDLLWDDAWARRVANADGARAYRDTWLRLAKNVAQAGRPVCIVGSAVPEHYELSTERRYFSASHYLALYCGAQELRARLRARPAWRGSSHAPFVDRMVEFNGWLIENAGKTAPPLTLVDTSDGTVADTVAIVIKWLREFSPVA